MTAVHVNVDEVGEVDETRAEREYLGGWLTLCSVHACALLTHVQCLSAQPPAQQLVFHLN
jgi:hypothetical protein